MKLLTILLLLVNTTARYKADAIIANTFNEINFNRIFMRSLGIKDNIFWKKIIHWNESYKIK